jgi:hypothetical protein
LRFAHPSRTIELFVSPGALDWPAEVGSGRTFISRPNTHTPSRASVKADRRGQCAGRLIDHYRRLCRGHRALYDRRAGVRIRGRAARWRSLPVSRSRRSTAPTRYGDGCPASRVPTTRSLKMYDAPPGGSGYAHTAHPLASEAACGPTMTSEVETRVPHGGVGPCRSSATRTRGVSRSRPFPGFRGDETVEATGTPQGKASTTCATLTSSA